MMWMDIVKSYTTKDMTFETDILVAISGIAKKLSSHLQGDYLAGLWQQHLPFQLLWHAETFDGRLGRTRPVKYYAPTWSWASVCTSVWSFSDSRDFKDELEGELFMVRFVDAKISTLGLDIFGQKLKKMVRAIFLRRSHPFKITFLSCALVDP